MRTTRSVNPVATDERRREVNLFDNRRALHLVYPGYEIVIQLRQTRSAIGSMVICRSIAVCSDR
jgi:hypothetical protein